MPQDTSEPPASSASPEPAPPQPTGLDRFFGLTAHGTNVRIELQAGLVTFLTMAYILFVQPAVLSHDLHGQPTGLAADAVLFATALSAAVTTLAMGLLARLPVALAPGMGINFFFVSVVMSVAAGTATSPARTDAWQVTLGMVFWAGVIFVVLSLLPVRQAILDALSPSLRHAVAAGIGCFIALLGLKNGQLINPAPYQIGLNIQHLASVDVAVFFTGFLVTSLFLIRKWPGAILLGILAATVVAGCGGKLDFAPFQQLAQGSWPAPVFDTSAVLRLNVWDALSLHYVPFILVFLFMATFDATGTLVGVCQRAGLLQNGQIPHAREAFAVDAAGSVLGACLGTSTVTSYIESAAGVEQGGRTGLTNVVVAVLFVVALLFSPLVLLVGSYLPITAAALVVVGVMMAQSTAEIQWNDPSEAIPAFLILLGIPLTFSITDGLALGLVTYPVLKLISGRWREVNWVSLVLAVALVAYFVLVRAQLAV